MGVFNCSISLEVISQSIRSYPYILNTELPTYLLALSLPIIIQLHFLLLFRPQTSQLLLLALFFPLKRIKF